jgi:hypothetical protein
MNNPVYKRKNRTSSLLTKNLKSKKVKLLIFWNNKN